MFYVGQKVCLIKNHGYKNTLTKEQIAFYRINVPKVDVTYTVGSTDQYNGAETIRLVECCNKHVKTTNGKEFAFYGRCFRPLTDISSLKALLNPKTAETV